MHVKPRPGLKVRDPVTKLHIPEAGKDVPDGDSFWVRRLADGDVVLATKTTDEGEAK